MLSGWNTSAMKEVWGSWACSTWRRQSLIVAFQYMKGADEQEGK